MTKGANLDTAPVLCATTANEAGRGTPRKSPGQPPGPETDGGQGDATNHDRSRGAGRARRSPQARHRRRCRQKTLKVNARDRGVDAIRALKIAKDVVDNVDVGWLDNDGRDAIERAKLPLDDALVKARERLLALAKETYEIQMGDIEQPGLVPVVRTRARKRRPRRSSTSVRQGPPTKPTKVSAAPRVVDLEQAPDGVSWQPAHA